MNKIILPALTVLVASAPGAFAQNFPSLKQTYTTRGDFQLGTTRSEIREVVVQLERNGAARIELKGQGGGLWNTLARVPVFIGRWSGNGREITVDLQRGWNAPVTGLARLRFDRDFRDNNDRRNSQLAQIESLSLEGRVGSSRWNTQDFRGQFELRPQFDDRDNDYGGRGNLSDLFATKRGTGTLRLDGERDDTDLRAAKVELERNGTAKITVEGRQNYIYEGTWRQIDRERIEINLDNAASTERRRIPGTATHSLGIGLGRGEIRLDGTNFRSLSLSGRRGDRNFRVEFSADSRDNNWRNGDSRDDWRRDDSRRDDSRDDEDWRGDQGRWNGNWRRN